MVVAVSGLCTADEVQQITGKKRFSAQIRWLRKNGWVFCVSGAGKVIIARSHLEAKLNPTQVTITLTQDQDEPDWSNWNAT